MDFLADRPPWEVLGPCLGLLVVGMLATLNVRMGVLGGWSDLVDRVDGRAGAVSLKAWFFLGVIVGGLVFHLLAGTSLPSGYGWLSRRFDSDVLVGVILAGAGVLIGYGAKTAGGCTSGNGLGGSSFGSPAALAATATFMGTAIAATFVIGVIL
jgi:uncharacterized protein